MGDRTTTHTGELDLAQYLLQRLADRFGAGLAAAARRPGLLAAIDQHAASVRDQLTTSTAMIVELASYADGLIDRATQLGWRPVPGPPAQQPADPDPVTVRLLAVCALHKWASARAVAVLP